MAWCGHRPAKWCCPLILLCQSHSYLLLFLMYVYTLCVCNIYTVCIYIVCLYLYIMCIYVYVFILLYFSACMDTTIQHPSTAIPTQHCALLCGVDMPCVSSSLYPPYLPHPHTCTWVNLLFVVYIGKGARRCAQLQLGEAVL